MMGMGRNKKCYDASFWGIVEFERIGESDTRLLSLSVYYIFGNDCND
jgi:hypothetical protein